MKTFPAAPNSSAFRPGFSLVEMIVVIAVLGILLGIAIPTYLTVLPSVELKSDARKLMFAFQRARQMASSYNRPARVLLDCTPATLNYEGQKNPCRLKVEMAIYDHNGVIQSWVQAQAGSMDLSPHTRPTYLSDFTKKREQFDNYQKFFTGFTTMAGVGPRTYGVNERDDFNGDSVVVVFTPSGEAISYSAVSVLLKTERKNLAGWTIEVINSTGYVRLRQLDDA
ncbi:MAG: prepilin-type N-terminal cleavage/methylation domain-containing protein [Deltaproteobacteria bacterium]|jgi:prepilin-type N-terminal cleavage/methylation domain-containing protein|nr:prepilin-type N-terminal cleavage/methylation domain-containing protein [Deltaproteobacteria bacterium]